MYTCVAFKAALHSLSVRKCGETWRSLWGPLATNCHQAEAGPGEKAKPAASGTRIKRRFMSGLVPETNCGSTMVGYRELPPSVIPYNWSSARVFGISEACCVEDLPERSGQVRTEQALILAE